jgi:peptide-methionine (S)-S-oxide reductase
MSYWLGSYVRGSNEKKHRGVQLLLDAGAYVPPEVTPPMLAIHRGDAKALADFLDRDRSLIKQRFADMPYGNISLAGATLLHLAAEFNEIDCLEELFKRDADINMPADIINGIGGQTPVFHVINTNWDSQFQTLEYLAKRVGQHIDLSVRATFTWCGTPHGPVTPIEFSNEAGQSWGRNNMDAERRLLASLDRNRRAVEIARTGDVVQLAQLLDADPNLLTPALWPPAIFQAKSLAITRLLLDRGLDPNQCSAPRRPLHLAVYQCLPDIIDLLIERGADVNNLNPLGERPIDLLDAYEPRRVDDPDARRIFKSLTRAGAQPDIHALVRTGDVERVNQAIDSDPSLLRANTPWPPLFSAARSGRVDVVKLLIDRGADVNARNDMNNTALWFACQSPADANDRIAVARLLIDAGAHVRAECEDRSTPLHFAAWRGPRAMAELLLRHGAREWQTDKDGQKPIDYGRRGPAQDKDAIVHMLDRPVIDDPIFKSAVTAIHTGDLPTLQSLLARHPHLVHDRAMEPDCYPPGYFGNPKLLWFVANNPTLMEQMPGNIVQQAEAIVLAGAEPADLDYTLELVMTSTPAARQGHQLPLMKLLLDHHAKPGDLSVTLAHCELEPVRFLMEQGLPITAPIAAALGRIDDLRRLLTAADPATRQLAFGLAVINRQLDSARLCLQSGADVNAFLPVHAHSLAAHQAAANDDVEMLQLLVEHGARLDVPDKLWNGTPLGWAIHEKKPAAEAYLRSL